MSQKRTLNTAENISIISTGHKIALSKQFVHILLADLFPIWPNSFLHSVTPRTQIVAFLIDQTGVWHRHGYIHQLCYYTKHGTVNLQICKYNTKLSLKCSQPNPCRFIAKEERFVAEVRGQRPQVVHTFASDLIRWVYADATAVQRFRELKTIISGACGGFR